MASIDLKNISVEFPIYNMRSRSFKKQFIRIATGGAVAEDAKEHVVVHALNQLSLSLRNGDRVGLIGHNGSGKSTLLRLLAQIYEPTRGELKIEGRISPLLDITHGIETEFTGYDNITLRGTILGLTREEIQQKMVEIRDFSGLGDYLYMPIRTYSAGMMVRLAFAISTCIHPDILLIDEIFGAGDASFMDKAMKKIASLLQESSIVIMATHSHELIRAFCNKALLLEGGCLNYFGTVDQALEIYKEQVAIHA